MKDTPLFSFRLTDDPGFVEIVNGAGEVVGSARVYDDSNEFAPNVWRWSFYAAEGNSAGGDFWRGDS